MKTNISFTLSIVLALLLTGCAAPKPAALSSVQVSQAAENILTAINSGNYQNFVQDFSDPMKSAFPEASFTKVRNLLMSASGSYASCAAPTLSNSQGYAVYRFICKFEKEDVAVTISFKVGGDQVEGLFFDSVNLRKAGQ